MAPNVLFYFYVCWGDSVKERELDMLGRKAAAVLSMELDLRKTVIHHAHSAAEAQEAARVGWQPQGC